MTESTLQYLDTFTLPAYALPMLINDDSSGIEDSDIEEVQQWLAENFEGQYTGLVFEPLDGGPEFAHQPAWGFPTDCHLVKVHGHPVTDTPDPIATITALHSLIEARLFLLREFHSGQTYGALTVELTELANMVHAFDGDTDDLWAIGEHTSCGLADMIPAAFWHFSEWHGGQDSPSYAALSALGQVFSPGMSNGPEEETSELDTFNQLAIMATNDQTIADMGTEKCLEAYRLHSDGEGANTVAQLLGFTDYLTVTGNRLINAGRDLSGGAK